MYSHNMKYASASLFLLNILVPVIAREQIIQLQQIFFNLINFRAVGLKASPELTKLLLEIIKSVDANKIKF